jgi:hypothetical protein
LLSLGATCEPLDLAAEGDPAVGAEPDDVEDVFAVSMPIETRIGVMVSMGCFSGCCEAV